MSPALRLGRSPSPASEGRRLPWDDDVAVPSRRASVLRHLFLAVVVYVPLLLTAPGRVAADTKTYLYLDPGRLLERAPSMWDPSIGLGTVTHQNIGYLWPMGPWYWTFDTLGAPDWLAQRLWLGTVMFLAGAGVLFLLRSLRWRGTGMLVAAAVYMLSPYVLHYGARISVLLLPWAGLPWLLGLTHRAVRQQSWRHPAIFALVTATVGGVNATALVMAGIGPLLWLPFAVLVHREASAREAVRAAARIGLLTVLCSLWWVAGLAVQGAFGIEILHYTETVETVARTGLASEVLRGLGYWFFYGGDMLGPWIEPGRHYTQSGKLLVVAFALPVVAFLAVVSVRWRYRAFFVALIVVGTAVAVGAYPYEAPSPVGAAFKEFATSSTVGLAMRSTPRAVPLVVLGLAVLTGAAISALSERFPRRALGASVLVVALAIAGLPPLWLGQMIGANLQRPEEIPPYWPEAAAWLDAHDDGTRVLVVPGTDFAAYRWGNTVDPVLPGLMDRPMVARELIPYGSPPSADLLIAFDRRINERVSEPASYAAVARLLNAGHLLFRADLQFDRYRTPRPRDLWHELRTGAEGLGEPVTFGGPVRNEPVDRELPIVDEVTFAVPDRAPDPAPVTVFPTEAAPIVHALPRARPVVLAGDGEGVVDSAVAGLLDGGGPVLYEADLALDPEVRRRVLDASPRLVLTDTNRRRQRRWSTVRENSGATETAGEEPLVPIVDQRLDLFPGAGDDTRSVTELNGVERIQASAYGNHVSYTPEARPSHAFDGDLRSAWSVGAFGAAVDHRLQVELDEPLTTDRVGLTQLLEGDRSRWVTEVELVLDGQPVGRFPLGEVSRTPAGEEVVFGEHTFTTMELRITGDSSGGARGGNWSSVGFVEIDLAGIDVQEHVRLPTSLLDELGGESADHDLDIVLTRLRSDPRELYRNDEEERLSRFFTLPTGRELTLDGDVRVSPRADDTVVDSLLGGGDDGLRARASARMVGDLGARPSRAFDGDPATAWRPPVGPLAERWVELEADQPLTVDRLDLQVVADGRHSVPTSVGIEADGERVATFDLPALDDLDREGAVQEVSLEVPPFTASRVRLVIDDVREVHANDSFSTTPQVLPVGVAEVGIDTTFPPHAATLDTGCRHDLLTVDGEPVAVRITGDIATAEGRGALDLTVCDGTALTLDAGDHLVQATPGTTTGLDLDRLVLSSPGTAAADPPATAVPELEVRATGRTSYEVDVRGADGPFWLVLGQSHNAGWSISSPEVDDIPAQRIVNGYANGWLVDPGDADSLTVTLDWRPQRMVWVGLVASALAAVACLALAVADRRSNRTPAARFGLGFLHPQLVSPVEGVGVRPSNRTVVVLTAIVGIVGALLVQPWVGALVAVPTAAALLHRRARVLLSGGAVGFVALAGAFVLYRQLRWRFPPDFGWPEHFHPAHVLAWVAILLLLADVVVGWARRRTEVL